jgi:hypothetical protein
LTGFSLGEIEHEAVRPQDLQIADGGSDTSLMLA